MRFEEHYHDPNKPALPSTALADSVSHGSADAGRVGNSFEVPVQPPTASFQTVNGFAYLFDLRPNSFAGRNIELGASPPYSSQTTVVASYRPADEFERDNNPGVGDGFYVSTPLRDMACQISFGAGSAQAYVELDVSEGIAMSLPCQSLTLAIYSTFFMRSGPPGFGTQRKLRCQAHLATGVATRPGQLTTRVFAPYQADLDLLDPPTIEQWIARLEEALCSRNYSMQAELEA